MDSDLIQLVNKLQDTFANLGTSTRGELDMPQIVVVGSQSAGKSSVLETIVGRDFLPRGSGIVTRRPLILQLVHIAPPDPDNPSVSNYAEYGQFLHLDKRFTDFAEIRREIEAETFRVAGQNKGISKLPISLRIYSSKVLDLTLVDLPGLTKVRDQPSDIERQIRNLVLDYISKPNSVILAVSAANVDLANSDALKLARSVDPQGRRTIGVLTKLDLMDAGTNALDILNGRVYPLKLGFIGVVNRSQQDINAERSMDDARDHEKEFFQNHPAYRSIAHRNGTLYLAKTLNHVLLNHIREKLPDMKARLNTLMGQTQHELDSFGDAAFLGDQHQGTLVLKLMTSFARDFVSSIEGTSSDISTKELSGGARIYYIFNDVFGHALESIESTSNLTTQDIRTAIRNSTGPRPSLFVPEVAFDLLVKPQIKLLEAPSLRCVELVYEELVKICHNCTSTELQRFPRLHARLIDVVSELLRERLGPTSEYAQSLIQIQAAYINTNHPSFMQNSAHAHANQQKRAVRGPQPVATEPNGSASAEDEDVDDDETETQELPNGVKQKDTRSVSSTVHDRSRAPSFVPSGQNPGPGQHHVVRHDRRSAGTANVLAQMDSPASAKDTFLNYFFGGNQPGMPGGAPAALMGPRHTQIGRDVDPESGVPSSALQGARSLDGNNAAFDMKSLGKHIEAVASDGAAPLSVREEMECNLIRSLIASYFDIVRQTIQDLIPKAIMHFLVNHTSQHVQNRLVASLYKPDLFTDLLHEDEALVNERTRVKALLDAYKEAFRTLSEVSLKPL
ncbi:dynamin protein dnm1 [Calocera viscosa TUFC12733]|uniref:Dynamin protein dnm1 n=1 Tax=Calocera viscosa (strain TUFC12733) TaxID=1330018 RepID=A0A167S1N6_CALVF|nr:dynamin protein dnm1 [Calocera viscosa TUFC12733]